MNLSIVYPAYNESAIINDTIARTVEAARSILTDGSSFEVVIVNDGSTDDTGALAEALARQYPEVVVYHNNTNRGLGPTLHRALTSARGKLVVNNGMDYPFHIDDLPILMNQLDRADVVVAERTGYPGYSTYRRVVSTANRLLLRVLFGLGIRDFCFVTLFKREVLDRITIESRSDGFVIPEAIFRAHHAGCRIASVPLTYHPRTTGTTVVGKPKALIESLRDTLRTWWSLKLHPSTPPRQNVSTYAPGSHARADFTSAGASR